MASVRPRSEGSPARSLQIQRRASWARTASGSRRTDDSMSISACSATAAADIPREFVRTTGLAFIAGKSMPPTPAAGLCTHRSACATANARGVSREVKATSAPGMCRTIAASSPAWRNVRAGNCRRSWPTRSAGMVHAGVSLKIATRTFMTVHSASTPLCGRADRSWPGGPRSRMLPSQVAYYPHEERPSRVRAGPPGYAASC
jgi:hypothetical protein